MADGQIEIEVTLDSDGAKKELDNLNKTMENGTKQAAKSSENAVKQAAKSAESSVKSSSKSIEVTTKKSGEKISQSSKKTSEETKRHYKEQEEQSKTSASNSGKYWTGAAGKIKNAASVAAKTSGAALVATGVAALKSSISFESAFAGVKKTVNASDKELSSMRKSIINMSKDMPTSANEIAGVAEAAGQLGIKTKNITGFAKTMVMLGDSTNMSADTAATSLARLANVTGMPQDNFDRLGSTIVALGNNLATTESEITDMAMRIAGAGSQVGMSEADIMSFSGALSSVGVEAEAGGTAFSTLLSKMNLATTKGGDSLNSFAKVAGMSSSQFKKAFKEDASGAVLTFIQGLGKVNESGGSAIKTLDDMGLSDVRMRDALLRAAGASDTFSNALKIGNTAWNENKALTNEASQRYKTLESKLGILKNRATALGIAVGDELKGPIADGVSVASKAIGNLADEVEAEGLEGIIPKETITTVKNLGSATKTVAGGGIKLLCGAAKVLGENMQTVVPVAATLLTTLKGYKALKAVSETITATKAAVSGFKTAADVASAMTATKDAVSGTTVAIGALTGGLGKATAASGIFKDGVAALGGPVWIGVLAVTAITAGVAAYALTMDHTATKSEKFASSCEKLSDKQDEVTKSLKALHNENEKQVESTKAQGTQADLLYGQLVRLMKVENKSAGTKARIKSVVEQLNDVMPELGLKYDSETDKLNKSTSAIKKNIKALKEQAMAKAYQSGMERSAKKVADAEVANEKAISKQTTAQEKLNDAKKRFNELKDKYGLDSGNQELADAGADVQNYEKALKGASDAVEKSNKNLETSYDELGAYTDKFTAQTNFNEFNSKLDTLAKEAGIKAKNVPASIGQGIKAGIYANPVTGADLKQLIKLDDLMGSDELSKMQQQGMKIPEYLTQGMSDGSITFKNAVKQLQNGIDWSGMIEKAKQKGIEVPDSVAQGIQSGQYAVPTSVEAVKNLVSFESLQVKAQSGGIQVPTALANGISSGSMAPKEAATQLSRMIEFQDAVTKAGVDGSKIPTELAQSVISGQTPVKEATNQLANGLKVDTTQSATMFDPIVSSSKSAASKVKTSANEIKKNSKIPAMDNSGAANSFKSITKGASSAANSVKSNTSKIKKASKISATDNSGAGKKTVTSYTSQLSSGAGKAKSSTKKVADSAATGFNSGSSKSKSAGSKLTTSFVSGIKAKNSQAKSAGKSVANAAKSGASGQKSGFVSVGNQLSAGIASGISQNSGVVESAARSAVAKAVAAAKAEAGIKSPSRVFKKEVGVYLPAGMAVGIRENTSVVEEASKGMAKASLDAATDELDIRSPSKKFKDIVGKQIPRGIAKGVREAQSELTAEMRSVVTTALNAAKSVTKNGGNYSEIASNLISGLSDSLNIAKERSSTTVSEIMNAQYDAQIKEDEKAQEKLQKKIDKTKNKKQKAKLKKQLSSLKKSNASKEKQLKTAGEKVANAFNTAYEAEAKRLTDIANKQIQELSDMYQEKYNEIKQLQDSLTEKQQSWGNVYDLDQNIMDIEKYQASLKNLEKKIPESMMEKILGMNMDEASAYMAWFEHMSDAEQKAYIDKWNKQQSMSQTFASGFFADDFAKIESEYNTKLKNVTNNLTKEMKKAGANIAKGLTSGMESETRNMTNAMKKLCNNLIKTAKKQLGIKSPSRKFAEIGKYDIQGAEKGHEKEAPKLYRQMDTIGETMAQRFAKANLDVDSLQNRMQVAKAVQSSKAAASVQQVVHKNTYNSESNQQVVYTAPEKIEVVTEIDGREVARTTAPYMDSRLDDLATRKIRGGV